VVKNGQRKAFHTGSNSSCRQHIRSHYELYQARCADKSIPEHHHALPREVWKEREATKRGERTVNLETMFQGMMSKKDSEFSRDKVLTSVAEFVVCDDQVSLNVVVAWLYWEALTFGTESCGS
jgi:hypothetical protein